MRTLALLVTSAMIAGVAAPAAAQNPTRPDSGAAAPPRDRTNTLPLAPTRTARFTTSEGTWMSVDVSPDGSTIVFDLLGDIYTVPMAGGKATRIIGGNSVDMHPRFSPDGKSLVFVSDRSGADATWLADANGQRPRLLTSGGVYPVWTPDGREVLSVNRLVDVRGGAGIVLRGVGPGASLTGDGRYVWFQNGRQAARYDRTDGSITQRTQLAGGVLRPMISRDGRRLAYFTRFENRTALVVRELATGQEHWVAMGMQPEAFVPAPPFVPTGPLPPGFTPPPPPPPPGLGPLPSAAWLPDESGIVTSYDGKLWRIDIASGQSTEIPFTADVDIALGALVRSAAAVDDSVRVREVRDPALSPDGRQVAFTALGKVWVMDLPAGTPRRLTTATTGVELSPAWTPDGQSVTYATWFDATGGDIMQAELSGGTPRNLTRAPALYTRLAYTPSGSRLVFARAPRQAWSAIVNESSIQARTNAGAGTEVNLELRWMAPGGGAQHAITMLTDVGVLPQGGAPHFTSDSTRVFFHDGAALVSVAWDGSDRKVVLARATPQTMLSPDGRHVVSRAGPRRHLYLFELPLAADSLVIDPVAPAPIVPVRRLTRAGGDFASFSRDGSKIVWVAGTSIHVYDVAQGDAATRDSVASALSRPAPTPGPGAATPDSTRRAATDTTRRTVGPGPAASADSGARWTPAYDAVRHDIAIALPADKPTGIIALRGARIVTMNAGEVIENGDIVITGNRITAVGARGTVRIPGGARSINVSGKTILPGYVDVHAVLGSPSQAPRSTLPQYLANLAFGITAARDPESPLTDAFTYGDRIELGEILGPRMLASGPVALDSAATLRTNPDARTVLGAYTTPWRTGTVRGDLSATRPDRQRFLTVALEMGLTATAMNATDFRKSLSAILDGYSSQHGAAYDIMPLQDDVARLMAESGLIYAPMLQGRIGTMTGSSHALASLAPHADPKVQRFSTHRELDRLTRARTAWSVEDDYPFDLAAVGPARIVAHNGKVAIGSGGRVQGLSFHWEMWLLSRGGMPNHEILRAATASGAEAIGLGAQLGSIEPGKLADLQVLDQDPLTDIRHTNSVRYVMKNGRLYDANTLDQVAPVRRALETPWWQSTGSIEGQR